MRRPWLWVLPVATLIAWLPMLSVFSAFGFADLAGCRVDESGATPCLAGGSDWGPTLTTMFVVG